MMEGGFGAWNMRVHFVKALLLVLVLVLVPVLALPAQRASALDPPYITPANPRAGEPISVVVRGDACDLIEDGVVWPPPVTQQGSFITILFNGIREGDPEFCYFSSDARAYPVGAYAAGSYTLQVNWRYGTFSGWVIETLGVIPFTVSAAPSQQPIEAPTLRIVGLGVLALVLLGAMLRELRRRLA
jgi:hypothetical protein